jgi:hypothetical protein
MCLHYTLRLPLYLHHPESSPDNERKHTGYLGCGLECGCLLLCLPHGPRRLLRYLNICSGGRRQLRMGNVKLSMHSIMLLQQCGILLQQRLHALTVLFADGVCLQDDWVCWG